MSSKVWHFKKPSRWKNGSQPATQPQITTLKTLKGKLKWDDATYQAVVERFCGKTSSKDLNREQASAMIFELLGLTVELKIQEKPRKPRVPKKSEDNVVVLANPMQKALIGHLVAEINWHPHGSYEAWLSKNMGLEKVVTKEEAGRVIEGLKGLKRHGHAKP